MHSLSVKNPHITVMPCFIRIAGNVFFIFGVSKDKAELVGMFGQKVKNDSVFKVIG